MIVEKRRNPTKIIQLYIKMKEDLKNCVIFDESIDEFWLYHFKYSWKD